jgi:hypothetical protein
MSTNKSPFPLIILTSLIFALFVFFGPAISAHALPSLPDDFFMTNDWAAATAAGTQYALLTGFSEGTAKMTDWLLRLGWKRENIIRKDVTDPFRNSWVDDFKSKVKPGDQFLFYYQGHGGVGSSLESMGETHRTGVFYTRFENLIGNYHPYAADEALLFGTREAALALAVVKDDDLTQLFSAGAWTNVTKTFILDACFSGGFVGGNDYDGRGDLDRLSNTTVIYSSEEEELTVCSRYNETVLTDYILKEGLGRKQADCNHDGIITTGELKSWVDNYSGYQRAFEALKVFGHWRILDEDFIIPEGTVDYETGHAGTFTNVPLDHKVGSYNVVPEPSTIILLSLGLVAVGLFRKVQNLSILHSTAKCNKRRGRWDAGKKVIHEK